MARLIDRIEAAYDNLDLIRRAVETAWPLITDPTRSNWPRHLTRVSGGTGPCHHDDGPCSCPSSDIWPEPKFRAEWIACQTHLHGAWYGVHQLGYPSRRILVPNGRPVDRPAHQETMLDAVGGLHLPLRQIAEYKRLAPIDRRTAYEVCDAIRHAANSWTPALHTPPRQVAPKRCGCGCGRFVEEGRRGAYAGTCANRRTRDRRRERVSA